MVLFAQSSGFIKGNITDSISGKPIEDVEISLINTSIGTYSDERGLFLLKVNPGEYTIKARMVGYAVINKEIIVYSGKTTDISIALNRKEITTEPLIVQDSKLDRGVMDVELSQRLLSKFPALAESDAFRSAQMLPSVSLPNDYSGHLYIRGSRFDQTLITFDDLPVYNPYHLGGILGTFNADAIQKIEFYPSVNFVNKSSRLSGNLNVIPNDGTDNKTKISLGVLSSRIQTGKEYKNSSYFISARRAYIDLLEMLLEKSGDRVGYSFYDLILRFDWQINRKHKISSSLFYSRDFLNYAPNMNETDSFNRIYPSWGNLVFSLYWNYYINKKAFVDTKLGYSDATVVSETENTDVHNLIQNILSNTRLVINMHNHLFQTGLDVKRIRYRYKWFLESDINLENMIGKPQFVFFDNAPADFSFARNTYRFALYVQDEYSLTQKVNFVGGIRYVYNSLSENGNLLPRIQINYIWNSLLTFSSAYARHNQYDYTLKEIKNSYFFAPFSVYFPVMKAEKTLLSDCYSVGFKITSQSYGNLNTEFYYKKMANIPSMNLYTGFVEKNMGKAIGFEILFRKKMQNASFMSSYSLAGSRVLSKKGDYFSSFDRRHNIKMFASYHISKGWHFNIFWTYISGLPYTPYLGSFIGAGMNDRENSGFDFTYPGYFYNNIGQVDIGRNSRRYASYHRMDLGIEKDWFFTDRVLSFKLQVINVYNQKNVAFIDYNTDILNQGPKNKNNLPVIPSIEISYEF